MHPPSIDVGPTVENTHQFRKLFDRQLTAHSMVLVSKHREENVAEPALEILLAEDRTPWFKKPHLRRLYMILFAACMGIEITSGFDSQIINTVQIVYTWNKCRSFASPMVGAPDQTKRLFRFWSPNRKDCQWTSRVRD